MPRIGAWHKDRNQSRRGVGAMTQELEKLISIASGPLDASAPELGMEWLARCGSNGEALLEALRAKNGFVAFEGALHVLSAGGSSTSAIQGWNEPVVWKCEYAGVKL